MYCHLQGRCTTRRPHAAEACAPFVQQATSFAQRATRLFSPVPARARVPAWAGMPAAMVGGYAVRLLPGR